MNIQPDKQTTGYRLQVLPLLGDIVAKSGETVIASSRAAKLMHETRLAPTVYFPMDDVVGVLGEASGHRTFCPFKGTANYWDVVVEDRIIPNGAWSYKNALADAKDIEGHVGFMPSVLSALEMGSNEPQPVDDGNIAGPTVDWIMRGASSCTSPEELTSAIGRKFNEDGIAVSRISVMIWSLHPMIAARSYVWTRKDDAVVKFAPSHGILQEARFQNSPIRHVTNGLGGVRQNLLSQNKEFNFPVMDELRDEGATDYVAMPLSFSNGQINVLTLASDHPDGFTTANLGLVFECVSMISRLYEVFALRENASTLLETYLGKRTGARVLGGQIRRGDGDQIDAAILFCDLRGSSRLEEELGREAYLDLLNSFFETTTSIVNAHEGEVLKFIGDAVLAIFPVGSERERACLQALESAFEIQAELANTMISDTEVPIEGIIGLAFGNVTYGNVGSKERLDFTVIGAAANIAARLSDLGKRLGHGIVASEHFSDCGFGDLESLGAFDLHNVSAPVEAYAPSLAAQLAIIEATSPTPLTPPVEPAE